MDGDCQISANDRNDRKGRTEDAGSRAGLTCDCRVRADLPSVNFRGRFGLETYSARFQRPAMLLALD